MSKLVYSLFVLVALTGLAMATQTVAAPGPELTGGVLGMLFAGGVVYLMKRQARRS